MVPLGRDAVDFEELVNHVFLPTLPADPKESRLNASSWQSKLLWILRTSLQSFGALQEGNAAGCVERAAKSIINFETSRDRFQNVDEESLTKLLEELVDDGKRL